MRLQLLRRYLTSKDMWRVLLLAAAAATGVRDPLPSRIYWLHIPKCGSSFARDTLRGTRYEKYLPHPIDPIIDPSNPRLP